MISLASMRHVAQQLKLGLLFLSVTLAACGGTIQTEPTSVSKQPIAQTWAAIVSRTTNKALLPNSLAPGSPWSWQTNNGSQTLVLENVDGTSFFSLSQRVRIGGTQLCLQLQFTQSRYQPVVQPCAFVQSQQITWYGTFSHAAGGQRYCLQDVGNGTANFTAAGCTSVDGSSWIEGQGMIAEFLLSSSGPNGRTNLLTWDGTNVVEQESTSSFLGVPQTSAPGQLWLSFTNPDGVLGGHVGEYLSVESFGSYSGVSALLTAFPQFNTMNFETPFNQNDPGRWTQNWQFGRRNLANGVYGTLENVPSFDPSVGGCAVASDPVGCEGPPFPTPLTDKRRAVVALYRRAP